MTLDFIDSTQSGLGVVENIQELSVLEMEAKITATEAIPPQAASPSTHLLPAMATEPTLSITTNSADADQLGLPIEQDLPRPFDCVSSDLAALGALSIEDFLSNITSSTTAFDVNFYVQLPESVLLETEKEGEADGATVTLDGQIKADEQRAIRGMIAMLHDASNKIFGSSDCLKFEYMEEDTTNRQCILTITRPNGATRSYKSDSNAGFTRRQDARMQAAKIAVEMGAIDFITSGDADALKARKGLLLNPFDVEVDNEMTEIAPGMSKYTEEEEPLKLIEDACAEWRASKVKPHWVTYNDSKNKKKHGAALRISLNAHVFRSYSVDPVYTYQRLAKVACARSAVKEGVIDFIMYGNGQTQPAKADPSDGSEGGPAILRELTPPPPPKGITLQEFFDTLPRPFPENIGETTANEFNAPAWLNLTLQSARGGRLVSSYTPIVDGVRHLHGCILRIERPGETRTYLVDPQFPKRSDARSAVCLLAMSQSVGGYIRGLKEEAENKLPADRRRLANEKLIQTLSYECSMVKPGNRLLFTFSTERDAFGCTLKADISSNEPDIREYTVNTEYRNKADAKAAVACLAAEQGLVDLLRFRGGSFPSDYTPFWDAQVHGNGDSYYVAKRKDRDRDFDGEGQDRKRRKGNFRDRESAYELGMNYLRSKVKIERPLGNGAFLFRNHFAPQPPTGPSAKNSWKKPRVSGSSGLEPTNGYNPSSRTVGQDRPEYRNSGASQNSRSRSVHPPTAPRALLNSSSSSAAHRIQSHDNQRVVGTESQPRQNAHTSQVAKTHSSSSPTAEPSRTDQYSKSHTQTGVDAHNQSYLCSGTYVQSATYAYPTTYTADPYSQHDAYGPMYPYPPPAYPSTTYPTPPRTHAYPTYYTPPPPASYSHYAYPASYAPYPNGHYPAYPPHPAHFSPPPPAPPLPHMIMPTAYSPPAMIPSPPSVRYSPGYHSPYSRPYSPAYPVSLRSPPQSPSGAGYSYEHNNQRYSIMDPHGPQNGVEDHRTKQERAAVGPPEVGYQPTPITANVQVKQEPLDDLHVFSTLAESIKEAPTSSNLAALYEFCGKRNTASPKFMFEVVKDKDGDKKFKVWAEQYSQRLELPTLFSNYEDGREKLAKRVLNWMRKRS